jgi:hypothetical protein
MVGRLVPIVTLVSALAGAQTPTKSAPKPPSSPQPARAVASSQGLSLSQVSVNTESFNPFRGQKSVLSYQLSRDAKITIKAFDPDRRLVRVLASAAPRKAGKHSETWDGRDLDGQIVPNEAYFFTIEAADSSGGKVVYDPMTFSGGEFADLTRGQMDRESGTLTYKLSQPSRVLLRAGLGTGLLLKTIVDWEPRSSGTITEYWNGKDDDGLFDVPTLKGTTMILTYMTLPENSVITIGNDKISYRAYSAATAGKRPLKEDRPMANARRISPHFLKNRVVDRTFRANLVFPDLDKAGSAATVPSIKDSALFRISLPDQDKDVLAGQQFELMIFVDTVFLLEEERGYLPFTSPLEVKALPPGDHIVTVNIITFGDQIGVGSRKIRVVK